MKVLTAICAALWIIQLIVASIWIVTGTLINPFFYFIAAMVLVLKYITDLFRE